jgi:(S)-ureidoglycine aminohydrolase
MQSLGDTRSVSARNYTLFTPDTFVRAPLPGMKGATAVVHASPAHGAASHSTRRSLRMADGSATP